ncbi:MAG: hypothetical protein ABIF40_04370 [archaeon]
MNLKTLGLTALFTGAAMLGCPIYTDTLDDDIVLDDDDSADKSSLEVLAVDDPLTDIPEVIDCEAVTRGLNYGFLINDVLDDICLYDKNMDLVCFSDYSEHVKLIVLGFGNCGACQHQAENLEDIYQMYNHEDFMIFEVLYYGYSALPADAEFLEEWEQDWTSGSISYHILMDPDGLTYGLSDVSAYPLSTIIGKCDVIRAKITGWDNLMYDEFYGAIDAAFDFDYSS